MQKLKNKTMTTLISLILMITIAIPLTALPNANAQTNPGKLTSYAFATVSTDPVGIGQTTYIIVWVDSPFPGATIQNDIRRHGYTITVKDPDGLSTELTHYETYADSTGIATVPFVPTKTGIYTATFNYAGQIYTWNETSQMRLYTGLVILPANRTITFTVQEEKIPEPIGSYPLPTEYWDYPIEGQNTAWWTISSHWLGAHYLGSTNFRPFNEVWQRDGIAPNTGHILWTKPIEIGGVIGGAASVPGETFYSGGSYEGRFDKSLIMHGILFYRVPLGHSAVGGGYAAVDLSTGEEIWYRDDLNIAGSSAPIKGQIYGFSTENQHGSPGGILWQVQGSTWNAIDPWSGKWMYTLTDVPSTPRSVEVYTDNGEIVRYVFNYDGRWMALWNFTQAPATRGGLTGSSWNQWRPNGKTINTSTAYSWNVTIPDLPGTATPEIISIMPGDIIVGSSSPRYTGTVSFPRGTLDPYTIWAISDKPATRGQLLWIKNLQPPPGNITMAIVGVDPVNRVLMLLHSEIMEIVGYSIDTGNYLWGPTVTPRRDLDYFQQGRNIIANGNWYVAAYGGIIFAYSTQNGTLLWSHKSYDGGLESPWGLLPIQLNAAADEKIYAFNNEHSPSSPLYKDYRVYAVDALTGKEVFTMQSWTGHAGGAGYPTGVVADGKYAYYNYYDNSIYVLGKGPSGTTVSIKNDVITQGNDVLITGLVTDISAGTQQHEQAMRFPSGIPAVSDDSMSAWMEYIYMQKPRPTNSTGVEVALSVLDSNGNYREIGRTTTNSDGFFALNWQPDIEGLYTVYATFAGSESYWPSHAVSSFVVGNAAATPAPTAAPQASAADMYFVPAVAGIIVAIIIVGAVLALLTIRKRP